MFASVQTVELAFTLCEYSEAAPEGRPEIDVVNGYAVDIVDRRQGWNASSRFFMDLGFFAKKYGCEWGGDWRGEYRDVAHVQMKLIDSAPRRSFVA